MSEKADDKITVKDDEKKNDPKIKKEQRILRISLAGSIVFLLAEMLFAILTRSMAILMDCVYDVADLIMIGPFLLLVPLLYKEETERRPYGFSQVESLFVMIKYLILLCVDAVLIINSIQLIFTGGNEVNASMVAYFEIGISIGCLVMYLVLMHMNKKLSTPALKAELFIWKLDSASTMAVGVAFLVSLILGKTKFAFITPYVDPAIAVILAVILLKEPVSMILTSIKNLVLFAPDKEIHENVQSTAEKHLDVIEAKATFVEIVRAGRKLWVEVYFKPKTNIIHLERLKLTQQEIESELKAEYEDISVELTPDLDIVKPKEDIENLWRKEKQDYIKQREEKKLAKAKARKEKAEQKKNSRAAKK